MNARTNILARLRSGAVTLVPERPDWRPPTYGETRAERFRSMLEAAHADVHDVDAVTWPQRLQAILANKGVKRLLYAPATQAGQDLAHAWGQATCQLVAYDQDVELMKAVLVQGVEAALTTSLGGIAETGSVVLWPNSDEPRLMSLLPPIHVALVHESALTDSLAETIAVQNWANSMPTNAILISGPSKTADIEQTLAYGVHGPKELIVLLIKEDGSTHDVHV